MRSLQPGIAPAKFIVLTATYAVLAFITLLNVISLRPALNQLLDFGSFVAAGKEAAAGNNPYRIDSPLVYRPESQNTNQSLPSPNLNPPLSVVIFRSLSSIEPLSAVTNWRIISAVLFGVGILILGWSYKEFTDPPRLVWALCLAGFWNTIALGQIYAPVFLLVVGAWIFMEKRQHIIAGILLGTLIAIKPNFLFWLLLLGLAGYFRTTASAIATFLVLSIFPILVIGPEVYPQWAAALMAYPSLGSMIAGNTSLQSLAARLGYQPLGLLLDVVLVLSALYYVVHQKGSLKIKEMNAVGIVSSILLSPFSWPGYTILTLPIFFSQQHWNWQAKAAAVILVFPYVVILYFFQRSFIHSVVFGWLYGWGLLLLLVGLFVARQRVWSKLQLESARGK